MRTPLQILVARDPDDWRTNVYVDTLRLAFEGSADGTGSPSAYIADAIDLGIRVLEPAKKIRDDDAERLLRGARHTILLETEAGQSILIALRTEAYENRYWCRREFLLAERSGMPTSSGGPAEESISRLLAASVRRCAVGSRA